MSAPTDTRTQQTLNLAVLIGSVREGRFGPVVANWFFEQAALHGRFKVDLIDLADTPLPLELPPVPPAMEPALPRPAEMAELTRRLGEADAIVVVTPDYNRSFPASLKAAIDWHYTQWQAKPIGFVGYSGGSGGLLAIDSCGRCSTNCRLTRSATTSPSPATTCSSARTAPCWSPRDPTPPRRCCWTSCCGGDRSCTTPGATGRTPPRPESRAAPRSGGPGPDQNGFVGRYLPSRVMTAREPPSGSSTFRTSSRKLIALMMPSPNCSWISALSVVP